MVIENDGLQLKSAAVALARDAGGLLLQGFGAHVSVRKKEDDANVVSEADILSERMIVQGIRRRFPGHSIIAEESGVDLKDSDVTWIVDPLDGTSNFAAGIPWFGVLIAVMYLGRPIVGVLHMPALDETYVAVAGAGTERNGAAVSVSRQSRLTDVLWAYSMDAPRGASEVWPEGRLLRELLANVRNIRTTNSLVDAAFTADGRFGGMVNHNTRLWDIAAPALIVMEAGGRYTGLAGEALRFDLSENASQHEYAVLAAAPVLHDQFLRLAAKLGLGAEAAPVVNVGREPLR